MFVIAAAVSFCMIFKGYGSGGRGPVATADAVAAGGPGAAQTAAAPGLNGSVPSVPDPGPAGIPGAAGGLARPLLGGAVFVV